MVGILNNTKTTRTELVPVDKDDRFWNKISKARLCTPTANKNTTKLLLILVARRGLEVRKNDAHREVLQTEYIFCTNYIKPSVKAGLPLNKGWFFGMYSLQFDSTTFGEFKTAYAAHVDNCLTVGEKQKVEDTHDKMAQKLQYGEVQIISVKILGINISRNSNGDVFLDQKHYLYRIKAPNLLQLQGFAQ